MNDRIRNILVLAASFPPAAGSGIHRVLKFVKYLPAFNWRCVVVSAELADRDDETLLTEIPPKR